MKKKLLLFITLFTAVIGYSQFTVNNIGYTIISSSTNVEITGYDEVLGGTDVNIPETVLYNGTNYSVTNIGSGAFINKGLTSVIFTLPSNISSIGSAAFRINQLTTISIPDSVISLGPGVFVGNQLNTVTLGNSLSIIGASAFSGNSLANVTIPDNVTSIGSAAFANNQLANVTLGASVANIDANAFFNNQLTSITFPSSVTSIGDYAFLQNSLTSITSKSTTPPTITTGGNADTFGERSIIDLIIPVGTTAVYETNTGALWKYFQTVTENATLSISNFELGNNIKIIATTDAINVVSPNNVSLQKYALYSISGAKITTGSESEIDTASFASGIYILMLNFDRGTVVEKVIIN